MRIAAVSLIKDEADIIELFVRVNAAWADHFYVVDNGSTDYTAHILRRLSEEGMPITVTADPSVHYHQSRMTTAVVRGAMRDARYDWVFPIDGDEFVQDPEAFKNELAAVAPGNVAAIEWMTLVPVDGNAMQRPAPLFDGFRRRRTELRRICKVVLPGSLARSCNVEMGNHSALDSSGRALSQAHVATRLAHVPVRSREQILVKTLVGSHKMSIKADRKAGEVFHWDIILEFVRANGFRLSDEQLRDIALGYGWSRGDPKVWDTEDVAIGSPEHRLRYAELAEPNVARVLDGFIGKLCEEIRIGRQSSALVKRLIRKYAQSW